MGGLWGVLRDPLGFPRGPQGVPKGSQGIPKGSQGVPKGPQGVPKGFHTNFAPKTNKLAEAFIKNCWGGV